MERGKSSAASLKSSQLVGGADPVSVRRAMPAAEWLCLQGCAGPSEGDDIVQSDALHAPSKPGGRRPGHALCTRPNSHPPAVYPYCPSRVARCTPSLPSPCAHRPLAPHRACPPHSLPRGPTTRAHSILLGTPWEPPANITLILHRASTPAPCHHSRQGTWAILQPSGNLFALLVVDPTWLSPPAASSLSKRPYVRRAAAFFFARPNF